MTVVFPGHGSGFQIFSFQSYKVAGLLDLYFGFLKANGVVGYKCIFSKVLFVEGEKNKMCKTYVL